MRIYVLSRLMYKIALLLSVLYGSEMRSEGFSEDTMISTSMGYVRIQDLMAGDHVLAYDGHKGSGVVVPIAHIEQHEVDRVVQLDIDGVVIEVDEKQLFFVPLKKAWVEASQLVAGQFLLGAPLRAECIRSVAVVEKRTVVYALSLVSHHNYMVSHCGIVVHNFTAAGIFGAAALAPVEEGFLAAFLAANPILAPVVLGVGAAGFIGYYIWKWLMSSVELVNVSLHSNDKQPMNNRHTAPQNNNDASNNNKDNGNHGPGSLGSIAALLKSLDESKEKVMEVVQKSCDWLQSSTGLKSIEHCFRQNCEHNFELIFAKLGGDTGVTRLKCITDITQKLISLGTKLPVDSMGVFKGVLIEYEGEVVTVQGRIVEGVYKVSTMFIQSQHVR